MRSALFCFGLGLAGAGAGAGATGCAAPSPPPQSVSSSLLRAPAPEFTKTALDGSRVALESLRGRVVLVDFFAEYCKPCLESLPELESLRQARPDIAIIGVAEDPEPSTVTRLVQQFSLGFPVIHDQGRSLAGRYRVSTLPATFVLNAAGTVHWIGDRRHEPSELNAVLDSAR